MVENVELPEASSGTLFAKVVVPSKKFTVPVGTPNPAGEELIEAVKVTVVPTIEGLLDDVSVIALPACPNPVNGTACVPWLVLSTMVKVPVR